jgi:HEAT repeat protein
METARITISWRTILCVLATSACFGIPQAMAATDAECRDILMQALHAKDPNTRKQAVVALSLVAGRLMTPLKGMLQDSDIEVRLATVVSISEAAGPQAITALRDALNDDVPEVRFAAARALWERRDTAGKEALLSMLDGQSETSSSFFSKQKHDMLHRVHSPRGLFQLLVEKGAGFVPVPFVGFGVASVQALLNDPSASGRAAVALMLAKEKDRGSLDALRHALGDSDWSVRAAAIHALAERKDVRLKTELPPLLDDDNQAVRLRAAAAYLRLGNKTAVRRDDAPRERAALADQLSVQGSTVH